VNVVPVGTTLVEVRELQDDGIELVFFTITGCISSTPVIVTVVFSDEILTVGTVTGFFSHNNR
jgi:hypothetical protein